MKSWPTSVAVVFLSAWLMHGDVLAQDEILPSYLAEAGGDTALAMAQMGSDIMLFTGDIEQLERDVRVATARADKYQTWYAAESRNWFERLWDSEVVKTLLFVLGFLAGAHTAG